MNETHNNGYLPTMQRWFARAIKNLSPQEKYTAGLLVLILIGLLFAASVQLYLINTKTTPARGGEYREAVIGVPRFVNPVLASANDVDRDLTRLIYSSLMRYNREGEIVTDLAQTYEILDGGRTYKFKLKSDIVWEDGTQITADDVVFTIKLIQDPQYSSPLFANWQGVEVINEGSEIIIFKLSSSYAPFLENTTVGILPRHIWQDITPRSFALADMNIKPLGSGPFKLEKFTKDSSGFISSYTIERNEKYHGQLPYLDKIIFKFFLNEEEAINAYNSNAVDGMAFLSPSNIDKIKEPNDANFHEFNMPRYFAVFINQETTTILEDVNMRRALTLATNRNAIIDKILGGFAQEIATPISPNLIEYYDETIETDSYDPEYAKRILDNLDWTDENGDGIREKVLKRGEEAQDLELNLVTIANLELESVALELAEQWQQVGIRLNVSIKEIGELQQNFIRPRSYELLMFGEILGLIPDPFSFWHSSQSSDPGLNLSLYQNTQVDQLLEDARQELDKQTRIDLYKKFQEQIVKDYAAIFLYDPTYIYPVHKGIQGIKPALIIETSGRFVDIENWFIETRRIF